MDVGSEEFFNTAKAACAKARRESLAAGLPVLYHDFERDIDVMEQPDGRKFQIRFVSRQNGRAYEIVRELDRTAA
jgi:hypothetical protein